MATPIYNFPPIKRGSTFKERFFWIGTGDEQNFVPTDITDYSICFQLRKYANGRVVHSFDCQIASAEVGKVLIPEWEILEAENKTETYKYDVFSTDANGKRKCQFEGTFTILENISQCQ